MTRTIFERSRGEYVVSTDPSRLDVDAVHAELSHQYWSEGIPRDVVVASIAGSIPFGVYCADRQIGFARVITDEATFAYLADVYIAQAERGRGLSTFLMECIMAYPTLGGVRRFMLMTRDASGLYAKFGFSPLRKPQYCMEIARTASELYGCAARAEPNEDSTERRFS